MGDGKVFVGFRLAPEMIKELDEFARRSGTNRTEILERCVRLGIREFGEKVKSFDHPLHGPVLTWLGEKPERIQWLAGLVGMDVPDDEAKSASEMNRNIAKSKRKKKGGRDES